MQNTRTVDDLERPSDAHLATPRPRMPLRNDDTTFLLPYLPHQKSCHGSTIPSAKLFINETLHKQKYLGRRIGRSSRGAIILQLKRGSTFIVLYSMAHSRFLELIVLLEASLAWDRQDRQECIEEESESKILGFYFK